MVLAIKLRVRHTVVTVSRESRWSRCWWTVVRLSQAALRAGADFVLPPSCLCCARETGDESSTTLCPACRQSLVPPPGPQCRKCAAPVGPYLDTTKGCSLCRHDRFHFDRVIRLGVYRDVLRSAVLRAKSATGEALARTLADVLFETRSADWSAQAWNVVVPVPHHWTQRVLQPHTASETIARRLAQQLGLPCDRGLVRKIRLTPPQVGTAPSVRRRQQRGAFSARPANGLQILLVDDVLTTGATADEVAKVLKEAGAASVSVAVLARGLGIHD